MATIKRRVEPGDFVVVPGHIKDEELLDLEFSPDSIRRLRRGEYVAGSLLTRGVTSGGRGRGRARGMKPGGDHVPTWRIDNLNGSILLMPDHMLVVSKGPPTPEPYIFSRLGPDVDLGYSIEINLVDGWGGA